MSHHEEGIKRGQARYGSVKNTADANAETIAARRGAARYGSICNDFDESNVKRDEGGKFSAGRTRSGKDVSAHTTKGHEDFDAADHDDAAAIHEKLSGMHTDKSFDHFDTPKAIEHDSKGNFHSELAKEHKRQAVTKGDGKKGKSLDSALKGQDHARSLDHGWDEAGNLTFEGKAFKSGSVERKPGR